jgi:hypothetical protein
MAGKPSINRRGETKSVLLQNLLPTPEVRVRVRCEVASSRVRRTTIRGTQLDSDHGQEALLNSRR